MGGGVDEDLLPVVVEPHRGEAGTSVRSYHRHGDGDGLVEQVPVDRIEVVEAGPLAPFSHRELPLLKPVRHVLEGRDRESLGHAAYLP